MAVSFKTLLSNACLLSKYNNMPVNTTIDYKSYIAKSILFEDYLKAFEDVVETNIKLPEEKQIHNFKYYPLNLQRTQRILKQYIATDELLEAINTLDKPLHWLVITEPWCGDASQIVPVIANIAAASEGKIQLHLVYRDENLELIDQYLTNSGRAIPKLLQLDEEYNFLAHWGPRPVAAQQLVMSLKEQNVEHDELATIVHKWYAENKAADISTELLALIKEA